MIYPIIPQSASTIIDPNLVEKMWCAYEHLMQFDDGEPPKVIYVNFCKLLDVHRLAQARRNTEWIRLTEGNRLVIVRVIATSQDRLLVQRHASEHMRAFSPMPICNAKGFVATAQRRKLYCSNGQQYDTQQQAAQALGISQSAVSKHLKGNLNHVAGYVFSFTPLMDGGQV
jgi:hypothetical protein